MKKLILMIFLIFILSGCGKEEYTDTYLDVFDTYSTLTVQVSDEESFKEISSKLHSELIRLNQLFDIYNNYDNINNAKTINDNAGISPVKVDKDLLELIKAGKEAYKITNGTINIAMGSVLEIWHNYRENALDNNIYAIPTQEELTQAAQHTDINSIVIDEENSTIFITDADTSIDLGAIAKGYCADFGAEYLKSQGINVGMLNLGGNVICLNDNKKKSFKIGIVSPDNPETYIDATNVSNASAVSSGNYQRYYEYEGKRYSHIIDPKTLFPAENNKATTIISDSSLQGDIFSTTLYILPYEEGKRLADENNLKTFWVTSDDTKHKTSNLETEYDY